MRTTFTIDDDVLAAARQLAERECKGVGEVLSALAREGLSGASRASHTDCNGILLLPRRKAAVRVTLDLVNQLRDEPS